MKIFLIFFLITLCGCQAVKYFGALPLEDFNSHVDEIEKFSKEAMGNQGDVAKVVVSLAHENVLEAKADNDEAKLDRSIEARVKAEMSVKEADRLSQTEFTRSKPPAMDWSGILMDVGKTLLGMVMAYFGLKIPMGQKLERIKTKAIHFAGQDSKIDIANDKDFK